MWLRRWWSTSEIHATSFRPPWDFACSKCMPQHSQIQSKLALMRHHFALKCSVYIYTHIDLNLRRGLQVFESPALVPGPQIQSKFDQNSDHDQMDRISIKICAKLSEIWPNLVNIRPTFDRNSIKIRSKFDQNSIDPNLIKFRSKFHEN